MDRLHIKIPQRHAQMFELLRQDTQARVACTRNIGQPGRSEHDREAQAFQMLAVRSLAQRPAPAHGNPVGIPLHAALHNFIG